MSAGASSGLQGAAAFCSCVCLLVPGNRCKFRCKHIKALYHLRGGMVLLYVLNAILLGCVTALFGEHLILP